MLWTSPGVDGELSEDVGEGNLEFCVCHRALVKTCLTTLVQGNRELSKNVTAG